MACLIIVVVMALVALLVLMLHQWYHKRLTFKWWVIPVILVVGGASFPQSIVTPLYFIVQIKVLAPYDLALWITDAWREYGRYAAFVWVIGFPLILWRKGITFETRRDAIRSVAVTILIMLPMTVFDANLFWTANQAEKIERISSVSPDGRLRVTAIGTEVERNLNCTLICEDNVPLPWLSRRLHSEKIRFPYWFSNDNDMLPWPVPDAISRLLSRSDMIRRLPMKGARLVWSADSKVVAFLAPTNQVPDTGFPRFVYDFSRQSQAYFSHAAFYYTGFRYLGSLDNKYIEDYEFFMTSHGGVVPQNDTKEP
jgi:hypothetical protein